MKVSRAPISDAPVLEDPVLRASGLGKAFGPVCAVDRLDLEIPRGQVTAFLGPNGAGKTTTLRMLLGLIQPDQGDIEIFGQPFSSTLSGKRRRETLGRIGALIEGPSLYEHLTGAEHLEILRRYRMLPAGSALEALRSVDLESAKDRKVSEYSLGMRQRLGIAMALAPSPDLLLLDEPMNGLDPAGIQELRHSLREMARERGMAVFLSSHLLTEVSLLADSYCIVGKGRSLFKGSAVELQKLATSRLEISVSPLEQAIELLGKSGYVVREESHGALSLELQVAQAQVEEPQDFDAPKAIAKINRLLVTHHCDVSRLVWQNNSLEEVFLELTHPSHSSVERATP